MELSLVFISTYVLEYILNVMDQVSVNQIDRKSVV